MTNQPMLTLREVFEEFLDGSAANPTPAQVADFQVRYPAYADEIAGLADDIARDDDFDEGAEADEAVNDDEDAAMTAIMTAMITRSLGQPLVDQPTLTKLVQEAGTTLPRLATKIGLDRRVLADVVGGRLRPPLGRRFLAALADALHATTVMVANACAASFHQPTLGHASADGEVEVRHRSFAEAIAASTMSEERKAHWLDQD